MIRPYHAVALVSPWALAALLAAGCAIRLPVAELCVYPAWWIAAADRYRCEDNAPEPPIVVPLGAGWGDLG